jgi:5-methylcytosine-specific restriction endonuclease McrA
MEHLLPQSLGGTDDVDNLALACSRCNSRRYNFMTGIDPETEMEVIPKHKEEATDDIREKGERG